MLTTLLLFLLGIGQAHPIAQYPQNVQVVTSNTVTGRTTALSATTVFIPGSTGLYEVCAGAVVTSAGSTGATLEMLFVYNNGQGANKEPVLGASSAPATTVGGDTTASGPSANSCQTVMAGAGTNIQIASLIGGSPTTPPTYTYWYTVILK